MKKRRKNKSSTKIVIFSVVLILAVASFYFFPTIVGALTPEVPLCDDRPNDYQCVCTSSQVKQLDSPLSSAWKCVDLPQAQEVTFPIETYEEAWSYATELLDGFQCSGEYWSEDPTSGSIEKSCNSYGSAIEGSDREYKGHAIELRCKTIEEVYEDGRPKSGFLVYNFLFDPNDGHVYELSYDSGVIPSDYPQVAYGQNEKESYETTCGDGCCHLGESQENCPQDCTQVVAECGDGICNEANGCFTDCFMKYYPEDYITNTAKLKAFLYGFNGTLLELDQKLKYACENAENVPNEVSSVWYSSSISDPSNAKFYCNYKSGSLSVFWIGSIDWNNKIAPASVGNIQSFYGLTKFPI